MNQIYYRDADGKLNFSSLGAVIVYDLGDLDSFDIAKKWVIELNTFVGTEVPVVIGGNKCDLPARVVPEKDVSTYLYMLTYYIRFASSLNSKYFYTSAKSGDSVSDMFQWVAQCIVNLLMYSNL